MRNRYETILKQHFRETVIRYRQEEGLTQEQMAQRLGISLRCYSNLESGKSCCSAVTLVRYLELCGNSAEFWNELWRRLEEEKVGTA